MQLLLTTQEVSALVHSLTEIQKSHIAQGHLTPQEEDDFLHVDQILSRIALQIDTCRQILHNPFRDIPHIYY